MSLFRLFDIRNSMFNIFFGLLFVYTDGNAYDFPQSTLFEIGLLEGCSTGKILSPDGQLEDYFESVQGPLRFVVSDTPDEADTLTKLRVGVPDAADTMYLTYSENLFQSKTMPEENSNLTLAQKSSDELENAFCVALYRNPGHGIAISHIKSDCLKYEDENCNQIAPGFGADEKPIEYGGFDLCDGGEHGKFLPLFKRKIDGMVDEDVFKNILVPFKVMVECYDKYEDVWKFSIVSRSETGTIYDRWDSLYLNVIETVCLENIKSNEKIIVVKNIDDPLNDHLEIYLNQIPEGKICKALQDFEYNRPYPADPAWQEKISEYLDEQERFYYILDRAKKHEEEHKNIFMNLVNETFRDKIDGVRTLDLLSNLQINCNDAPSIEIAQRLAIDKYKSKLTQFMYIVQNRHLKKNNLLAEINAQKSAAVQLTINHYIELLKTTEGCIFEEIKYE